MAEAIPVVAMSRGKVMAVQVTQSGLGAGAGMGDGKWSWREGRRGLTCLSDQRLMERRDGCGNGDGPEGLLQRGVRRRTGSPHNGDVGNGALHIVGQQLLSRNQSGTSRRRIVDLGKQIVYAGGQQQVAQHYRSHSLARKLKTKHNIVGHNGQIGRIEEACQRINLEVGREPLLDVQVGNDGRARVEPSEAKQTRLDVEGNA